MTPIVAIVGRPNVGKSTLFNRLTGKRLAIVDDAPGATRDRNYADASLQGRDLTLIDTGGFDPTSDDAFARSIARQVRVAIEEADAILCVLDGTLPPAAPDAEAVQALRRSGKPVIYAANKIDNAARELGLTELYDLGVDELIPISALHGRGTDVLARSLTRVLPVPAAAPPDPDDQAPRVALIGRPNAGKSSLLNRLAGKERALVDPRPGTTRDPIDSRLTYDRRSYVIVDTAGIRRRSKVDRGVEAASVMRAIRAVDRAEVVVLVCNATLPFAEQDARLLGLCAERGRAIVVGLNQIDRLTHRQLRAAEADARRALHFAPWAPILPLSATTGAGLRQLMRSVWRASEQFRRRVSTAELNRFLEQVITRRPPPTQGGRAPRIYYITQAHTAPPVFVAVSSAPSRIRDSYRRFLANQIRTHFGFASIPLRVRYKKRSRRG